MSDKDSSSDEDKSQEPSQKKLQKSREQGDVAYSSEATAAATYISFFVALIIASGWMLTQLQGQMMQFLAHPEDIGARLLSTENNGYFVHTGLRIGAAVSPVFAMLIGGAVVSIIMQRAVAFAPTKLKPQLSRISIIGNAKKKYGWDGISEFLKSATKLSAILLIIWFAYKDRFDDLPALAALPAAAIMPLLLKEAVFFCGLITIAAIAIASIDLPWRHFQHRNRLKMSYKELKDEQKDSEGDPFLKSARRQRAESIATNRMMADVPNADIIIVNPTHYAVALKWDRGKHAAPICLAKGVDEIAARIREAASSSGIPIKRDPPTARSIYSLVDVGHEIKKEHYAAVAAAIHYADVIRKKWRQKS